MKQTLGCVSYLVPDYDEAIAYFTKTLNFTLVEDTILSESKRWVLVAQPGPQAPVCFLHGRNTGAGEPHRKPDPQKGISLSPHR